MQNWSISEPRNVEFADEVRTLEVRIASGRLSVVGTDGPPRVEVSRIASEPVEVQLTGGALSIRLMPVHTWPGILTPLWWWLRGGRAFDADVSIAVPYETACTLWLGNGSLVASTVHADVAADCVNGRITLLGVDGQIRSKVISGPIEALGCAGDLNLETVSGEIVLADSAASKVRAKTVSGSLIADLDNPPYDSDIDLETISGEITIRVREDSDLSVRMNAAHGRVTSDFPDMSVQGQWGASVTGKLGSGSGRLKASAVGGNVALLRRPVDVDFDVEDAS